MPHFILCNRVIGHISRTKYSSSWPKGFRGNEVTGQRPPSSGSRLQTLFTSLSPHPTTYPTRTVFLQTNLDTRTFAPIYHTQQILGCGFETLHRNATWRRQWRDIQLASASFATRANFSYKESKKTLFF